MKRKIVLINIIVLFLSTSVFAAEGLYISGNVGAAFLEDVELSKTEPGLDVEAGIDFEHDLLLGAAAGYKLGMFRFEGDFGYVFHEFEDIDLSGTVTETSSGDGGVTIFSLLLNAFIDIGNDPDITPYVGGGAGFANIDWEGISISGVSFSGSDEVVFAYQFGGGVGYQLEKSITLDVAYRHFIADDITLDGNNVEYHSNNFFFTLRYYLK